MTKAVEPARLSFPGGESPEEATPTGPTGGEVHHHPDALHSVHDELARIAAALQHGAAAAGHGLDRTAHHVVADVGKHCPAWLRPTAGENRWPVAGCILVAILLQVALPDRLSLLNRWLLPLLELALHVALVIAVPRRFHRRSRPLRAPSLALTGLLTVANGWSAGCWWWAWSPVPRGRKPARCCPPERRSG